MLEMLIVPGSDSYPLASRHLNSLAMTHFPVIEIFGPTIQGEGPQSGQPSYFVRLGGCDFRCSWCDSMFAVDPAAVRIDAEHLDERDILDRLSTLPSGPRWVVLTGGNPALFELGPLVECLHSSGFKVAVETQGSHWRQWLEDVDCLVVSPKPPSSSMAAKTAQSFGPFMRAAQEAGSEVNLKVVLFEEADIVFAEALTADFPDLPVYLSAGTDVGLDEETTISAARARYRWACERVASTPRLSRVRVLPQLHVLAWGNRRAV